MLALILKKLQIITDASSQKVLTEYLYRINESIVANSLFKRKHNRSKNLLIDPNVNGIPNIGDILNRPISITATKELLTVFERNIELISDEEYQKYKNYFEEGNYIDFYTSALQFAGLKINEGKEINLSHEDSKKPKLIRFQDYIYIIYDELKKTNKKVKLYDAVILAIPDNELKWAITRNDVKEHFLYKYKDSINECSKNKLIVLLKNLKSDEPGLSLLFDDQQLQVSVRQMYTHQNHHYILKILRNLIGEDMQQMIDTLKKIINSVCNEYQRIDDTHIQSKFNDFAMCSANVNGDSLPRDLEYLCILFWKLTSCILLFSMDVTPRFEISLMNNNLPSGYDEQKIKKQILEATAPYDRLGKYICLYNALKEATGECVARICTENYHDFFKLVNDVEVQDEYLFIKRDETHRNMYNDISLLYLTMYDHIKYSMYRDYDLINSDAGLMRNCLTDRKIVLDFLNSDSGYHEFRRRKTYQYYNGNFCLRKATVTDIDNIKALNNPPIPYPRSIYVKSDEHEIRSAISDSIWIIEEISDDGVCNPACVAVIRIREFDIDNAGKAGLEDSFNSDALNDTYALQYSKDNALSHFKYIDFDSVLVNDGRSNVGSQSYRGYGFQRVFLVLAEEIARAENRKESSEKIEYICATVSSTNFPSKRNFLLAEYTIAAQMAYKLPEDSSPSEYYTYINSPKRTDEERATYIRRCDMEIEQYGKEALLRLGITEERYRADADVPRDFMLLKL